MKWREQYVKETPWCTWQTVFGRAGAKNPHKIVAGDWAGETHGV